MNKTYKLELIKGLFKGRKQHKSYKLNLNTVGQRKNNLGEYKKKGIMLNKAMPLPEKNYTMYINSISV